MWNTPSDYWDKPLGLHSSFLFTTRLIFPGLSKVFPPFWLLHTQGIPCSRMSKFCMDSRHVMKEKSIHYHNRYGKTLVQEYKLLATGRKLWEFSAAPSCLAFLLLRDRTQIKAQNPAVFFSQSQHGLVIQGWGCYPNWSHWEVWGCGQETWMGQNWRTQTFPNFPCGAFTTGFDNWRIFPVPSPLLWVSQIKPEAL